MSGMHISEIIQRSRSSLKTLFAIAVFAALCVLTAPVFAGDVKLNWTSPDSIPNASCADGSAVINCPVTGYEIGQGATQTGVFTVKETLAGNILTRTYANLAPGQYCFLVKTLSGTEKSAESSRICATVPSIPPKAPQGLTVTVTVSVP